MSHDAAHQAARSASSDFEALLALTVRTERLPSQHSPKPIVVGQHLHRLIQALIAGLAVGSQLSTMSVRKQGGSVLPAEKEVTVILLGDGTYESPALIRDCDTNSR
jgi:hypothetical protein